MKKKIKLGTITAVVIVGLMIAGAFVSAAVRTTTSSSLSKTEKGNNMAPTGFFCGDVNHDGVIDISDVIGILNYLFINGPSAYPDLCVGDVNGDAIVDASDLVYTMNYLFVHGPEPGGCCY